MHLHVLDDVRLIESVILTQPTDCTDLQVSRCEVREINDPHGGYRRASP